MEWMIYGATGYSGELIAREAKQRGLTPVLAGRSAAKLHPLADELGLEARAFALDRPEDMDRNLHDIGLVLHCAGPFSQTSAPMIEACLRNNAHYLDITGEIPVFEHAHAQDHRAREAGVVLCPGVGFDVIPTDCVACALRDALPDATHLALGFDAPAALSPGTAKTSVESAGCGGRVRRDGHLLTVPLAHARRRIDFGDGTKQAMAIPWGDVATAYYTTGIPNIEVYVPAPATVIALTRSANLIRPLLRRNAVQKTLQRVVEKRIQGPDADARDRTPTYVWGEARNAAGETRTARIKTANTYSLTITGALAVVQHLLEEKIVEGGSYTPALLVGPELVERLPGSGPLLIN
jgi:short subunit dehydrogenase-like uncharacterized protein